MHIYIHTYIRLIHTDKHTYIHIWGRSACIYAYIHTDLPHELIDLASRAHALAPEHLACVLLVYEALSS
jgi:hypothetical protein